jgi:hypothetical protein
MKGFNILGIIVALVLMEALGFAWYGPLFGAPWMDAMRASGITVDPGSGDMTMTMTVGVVNSLIVIIGLNWVLSRLGALTLMNALSSTVLVWFFFNLTTMAIGWLYMSQTLPLLVINSGFQLVSYLIAAFCIAVVRLPSRAPAAA